MKKLKTIIIGVQSPVILVLLLYAIIQKTGGEKQKHMIVRALEEAKKQLQSCDEYKKIAKEERLIAQGQKEIAIEQMRIAQEERKPQNSF